MNIDRTKYFKYVPNVLFNKALILLIIAVSVSVDLLNVTSILISVDYISSHFKVTHSLASWSLSAYAVSFSGFIAFAGRIGDVIGHDSQFIIGSLIFAFVSLICAAVDDIYVFIVFRAFQGLAAAMVVPSSYAMVAHMFEGKKLSLALTLLSAMLCFSQTVGLIVGGAFLRTSVKYSGVLYTSFALSLLIGCYAFCTFPKVQTNGDNMKDLDYTGSAILISGLLLIIVGFTEGGENWGSPKAYVILAVGLLMVGAFFIYETFISPKISPRTHLLIPREVWSIENFVPLVVNAILNYGGFFGTMFISMSYDMNVENDSALTASLKYIPSMIALLVASTVMSKFEGKFSAKWIASLAFITACVGLALLTRVDYRVSNQYWKYSVPGQILLSYGAITYFIQYLNLIVQSTPLKFQGVVSGISQTFAQFGTALGFAVITSIVGNTHEKEQLHSRYQYSSYFTLGCYIVGTILILFFVHDVKQKKQDIDEEAQGVIENPSDNKV